MLSSVLIGCGGGQGGANNAGAGTNNRLALTRFDVDIQSGKVYATPLESTRAASGRSRAIFGSGAVSISSSDLFTVGGDSGQRALNLTLTSTTAQPFSASAVAGARLIISNLSNAVTPNPATIAANTAVSTLVGSATAGQVDGPTTSATLSSPNGVCPGAGPSEGAWFLADTHKIRRVDANGTVTTIAGQAASGYVNGFGTTASFNSVQQIACDEEGNLFVADKGNRVIRRITPQGNVTTIAGTGALGDGDGSGSIATFNAPFGIAVSSNGYRIYVSDLLNRDIRLITLVGYDRSLATSYLVSHVASNAANAAGSVDGVFDVATFTAPAHLALLTNESSIDTLFVADKGAYRIRRIDSPEATEGAIVTTVAGTGAAGAIDGRGNTATFTSIIGLTGYYLPRTNVLGNYQPSNIPVLFVADGSSTSVNKIRAIQLDAGANPTDRSSYNVYTIAGAGGAGSFVDGTGTAARFNAPQSLASVPGTVLVGDALNHRLRRVAVPTALQTGSGTSTGTEAVRLLNADSEVPNTSGANAAWATKIGAGVVGNTTNLQFYVPSGVNGFTFTAYIEADSDIVNLPGQNVAYVSTIAGDNNVGNSNGPGKLAEFNGPNAVAPVPPALRVIYSPTFGVYLRAAIADKNNGRIRGLDIDGNILTLATGFSAPSGVAIAPDGSFFVADTSGAQGSVIRRIGTNGITTVIAGTAGTPGTTDGAGDVAKFTNPTGIVVDSGGTIYVSEVKAGATSSIRRIVFQGGVTANPALPTSYTVSTPLTTGLTNPYALTIDTNGQLYVVNGTGIKRLSRTGVNLVAADFLTGLTGPKGVAIDTAHNVYFTDNNQLKRANPAGAVVTIIGTGGLGFIDGTTTAAFNNPQGIAIEAAGTVLVADYGSNSVRAVQRIVNY